MADGKLISVKQVKIDKANQTIVAVVAVCAFIIVFSLVAAKSLLSQYSYQNRVSTAQQTAVNQLKSDNQAATNLISSYNTFVGQTQNMIGGNSTGTGNQDGSNSKLILDALPDTYDFPALVTSVSNLLNVPGVTISSITGTDTSGGTSSTSATSTSTSGSTSSSGQTTPITIPFSFSVIGTYSQLQTVISNLQHSIRPIQILTVSFQGSDSQLTMEVTAQTYYLPASGLNITTETIR